METKYKIGLGILAAILLLGGDNEAALDKQLTPAQLTHLNSLHPAARARFKRLIIAIQARGYSVSIISSYRSIAQQQALYSSGQTPAAPGRSYHNYGLALDINMSKGGQTWRMASGRAAWLATGVPQLAKSLGFNWGGDFGGYYSANGDNVHFDLRLKTISELLALASSQSTNAGNRLQIAGIGAVLTHAERGTQKCADGKHSTSAGKGACSYHGGTLSSPYGRWVAGKTALEYKGLDGKQYKAVVGNRAGMKYISITTGTAKPKEILVDAYQLRKFYDDLL